jgi:ubiquinone/menaquinone biosynthesis C-methylase UbiE
MPPGDQRSEGGIHVGAMNKSSIYLERSCAEEYDEDRFAGAFGRFLQDHEVETFLSLLDGSRGTVLDVGAGTGKLSFPLLRQSRQVISVDASSEMLRIAGMKAKKDGRVLTAVVCDANRLCFRNDAFECVISSRVLMHLADWQVAFSELCRVTRRLVVVDFPPVQSFAALDSLFKIFGGLFLSNTRPYRSLSVRKVKKELKDNNFRIIAIKKHFFFPIIFHRLLNRPRVSLALERVCRVLGLVELLGAPVTLAAVKDKTI